MKSFSLGLLAAIAALYAYACAKSGIHGLIGATLVLIFMPTMGILLMPSGILALVLSVIAFLLAAIDISTFVEIVVACSVAIGWGASVIYVLHLLGNARRASYG